MANQIAVRFVVAPFFPLHVPALGVSTLKAILERAGIHADIAYCNLDLLRFGQAHPTSLRLLGSIPYTFLASEMLFSKALWKERAPSLESYLERLRSELPTHRRILDPEAGEARRPLSAWPGSSASQPVRAWASLYENASEIVRVWAEDILRDAPDVVGFTVTSQQNLASLALAQAISLNARGRRPAILFGGPNCFDDNGKALLDNFPFIDAVVSGEADDLIVDLVREVSSSPPEEARRRFVLGHPVEDLDRLPHPVFEDYFRALEPYPAILRIARLAAESSRGCWWGMGSPCTFCARHSSTMTYRAKSPQRIADELVRLSAAYGGRSFLMADNVLPPRLVEPLSRLLENEEVRLYYEVRATLGMEDLRRLKRAGVTAIQPGIESLNTRILRSIRKGTTKLKNIQLLKHASELGQRVIWNFLYGIPGETPEDYRDTAETIRSIYHLPPPGTTLHMLMMRFSPYWHSPERYGLQDVRPHWSYDYAYPGLDPNERARIAFLFEYGCADGRNPEQYMPETLREISTWRRKRRFGATLEFRREGHGVCVVDSRFAGPLRVEPLSPLEESFLARTRDVRRLREVVEEMAGEQPHGDGARPDDLETTLAKLRERRWVIEEEGAILSLVLDPPAPREPPMARMTRGWDPYGLHEFSRNEKEEWKDGDP